MFLADGTVLDLGLLRCLRGAEGLIALADSRLQLAVNFAGRGCPQASHIFGLQLNVSALL